MKHMQITVVLTLFLVVSGCETPPIITKELSQSFVSMHDGKILYDKIIIARDIQQVGENKYEVTDLRRRFLPSDQQVAILWRWLPGEGSIGTYVLKGPSEDPRGGKLSISNGGSMLVRLDVSKCHKDTEFVVERYVDDFYKDGQVFIVEVPREKEMVLPQENLETPYIFRRN